MKNSIKFGLAAVVMALITAFCSVAAACAPNEKPTDKTPDSETDQTDPKPEVSDKTVTAAARQEFEDFVAGMALSSYTYQIKNANKIEFKGVVENGKKAIYDYLNGTEVISCYENSNPFTYTYNEDIGKYIKENAQVFVTTDFIWDDLNNASLKEYDGTNGEYTATIGGKDCTLTVSSVSMKWYFSDSKEHTVTNLGSSHVSMPASMLVDDRTENQNPNPPVITPDPDEPIIEENKVYTEVDGKVHYDSKKLAYIFKTALNSTKEGESYNLYANISSKTGKSVDEVKYISTDDATIECGAVTTLINDKVMFERFSVDISTMNGVENDAEKWAEYLVENKNISRELNRFTIQYSTDDLSKKEEVIAVAEKVIAKLVADGVQTDINTKGTALTELEGATVIWAFSIEVDGANIGMGLGNIELCGMFILAQKADGSYIVLDTRFAAKNFSDSDSAFESLTHETTTNRDFVVYQMTEREVNSDFFAD